MAEKSIHAINPIIGNISFFKGAVPAVKNNFQQPNNYVVQGNPNRPESRDSVRGLNIYYLA